MDKSQLRIRPGFVVGLLLVVVVIPWLVGTILSATRISDRTKAQIIFTRSETKAIAHSLNQVAAKSGSLTNVDGNFLWHSLFGAYASTEYSYRTNRNGELLDIWRRAYKIEIFRPTNFTIRSAGRDRIWDTKDDIIFNSVSNDFVKP